MSSGSVGRSLVLKQAVLTCVVLALGAYAYSCIVGLEASGPATSSAGNASLAIDAEHAGFNVIVATVLAALAMFVPPFFYHRLMIAAPLRALATAAASIADGHAVAELPGAGRSDEIGAIAQSLATLQQARMASKDAPVDNGNETLWQDRNRQLSDRVNQFAAELGATVRRLGTMTKRLADATGQMAVAAKQANEGSDHATAASSNAAGDVSSVATASEQLLHSIEEISRQVVQATSVVHSAVERAVDTNAGMGRLSTAAQKVGDVISLISRIAAQTNLLALNATIEAARAGEAGRGFAVVAQEVKTLATQTAKATQDITGQIAEMQEATDLSVEAIGKIQTKIAEVQHISTIIASAVHEQGAATQEIARNVRSAAAGTATMSSQIENVVRSIADTSANASSISLLARDFDEIATSLTDMVTAFGQTLKAA